MTTSITETKKTRRGGVKIWAVAFWLIVWQLAAMAVKQEILLVSPVSMLERWFELIKTADFWGRVGFTSLRIMKGLFLGALVGSVLGVVAGKVRFVRDLFAPVISVIRAIPVASFIILAIWWMGEGALSTFISFMICLPVFYTNLLAGTAQSDHELLEMAKIFRLGPVRRFRYVFVPQVFPFLKAAFNVSIGLAWKSGTAAELITVPTGSIGELLHQARIFLETADNLAWAFTIILLSLSFEMLIRLVLNAVGRILEGK